MNSTPAPPPSTPRNITMNDLKVSQSFINDAATLKGVWDLTTGTAIDGTSQPASLSIHYDAATKSYAFNTDARNETFAVSDITAQDIYDTAYLRGDAGQSEMLTLVKQPYTAQAGLRYVAMGFWQSHASADGRQSNEFSIFTYGLPTASEKMPRSGAAAYGIDMFGLVTMAGEEPMSFQGKGKFSVDFTRGIFTTQASSAEYGLVTDKGRSGGGIELRAGGQLSSTGTFSGPAVYGSSYGQAAGTIAGRFHGPAGEELGGAFQTANAAGMAAVGAIVGSRDASQTPDQQTLTGMTAEHIFYARHDTNNFGSLHWLNAETFDYSGYSSDMVGGRFTSNDKIPGKNPNFITYTKSGDNGYGQQDVVLELYKPGSANTELALTYASFGHWAGTRAGSTQHTYFTYGFTTGSNFSGGPDRHRTL
ncbi:MAG: hypothetical protein AB7E60_01390 [Sphingobium sp.]